MERLQWQLFWLWLRRCMPVADMAGVMVDMADTAAVVEVMPLRHTLGLRIVEVIQA